MLNAELKSTNSTLVIGCGDCCVDSILWRPVHSVSKLVLVQVSRDGRFDLRENESLKVFGNYGGESNWAIFIKAVHCTFLLDWDDGCRLCLDQLLSSC